MDLGGHRASAPASKWDEREYMGEYIDLHYLLPGKITLLLTLVLGWNFNQIMCIKMLSQLVIHKGQVSWWFLILASCTEKNTYWKCKYLPLTVMTNLECIHPKLHIFWYFDIRIYPCCCRAAVTMKSPWLVSSFKGLEENPVDQRGTPF